MPVSAFFCAPASPVATCSRCTEVYLRTRAQPPGAEGTTTTTGRSAPHQHQPHHTLRMLSLTLCSHHTLTPTSPLPSNAHLPAHTHPQAHRPTHSPTPTITSRLSLANLARTDTYLPTPTHLTPAAHPSNLIPALAISRSHLRLPTLTYPPHPSHHHPHPPTHPPTHAHTHTHARTHFTISATTLTKVYGAV